MSIGFIWLLAVIGVFFLCRELMCWYWKINKSIENQERIILLLQQLFNKQPITPIHNSEGLNTVTGYEGYIGQQVEVIQKNGLKLTGQVVASDAPEEYLALSVNGGIMKIKIEFIKEIKICN